MNIIYPTRKCAPCEPICKTCESKRNKCTSCHPGTFLKDGLCINCFEGCADCPNSDICDKCADGYYSYYSGQTTSCNKCPEKCLKCSYNFDAGEYCNSCAEGYKEGTPSSNENAGEVTCTPCTDGCLSCPESTEKCEKCRPEFIQKDGKCLTCDTGCLICQGETSYCLSCTSNYYLDEKEHKCKPCQEGCEFCINNTYCTSCPAGTYSNKGVCTSCHESCSNCHDGTDACDLCAKGYRFNAVKRCVKCPENCNECESETKCTLCKSQYYLKEDGLCAPCNCGDRECENLNGKCIDCPKGTYISRAFHVCLPCNEACSECDGPGPDQCSECKQGYFMATPELDEEIERNICQPCEQGCSSCTGLYDCTKCVDGYFLGDSEWGDWADDSDCHRCKTGCAKCNNKDDCTECKPGYFISSQKDNLVNCSQCPINCKSCTQSENGKFLVCNECIDGYYLNEGECKRCNIKCTKCTSESQCTECTDGYLLSGGSCETECSPTCESCDGSADKCTTCANGYVMAGSTCQKCLEGCKTCEYYDFKMVCTSCIERYALNKETGTCEKCHESCLTCYEPFKEGSCFECPSGYYKRTSENYYYPFYTGDCTKCTSENHGDANCIECTSSCRDQYDCKFVCTKCAEGYYINDNNKCSPCHYSCSTCFGDKEDQCYSCREGFYEDGSKCSNCSSDCLGCENGKCTSCRTHKYLKSDGTCEECDDSCAECEGSPRYCTKCPDGKFSYKGNCLTSCLEAGIGFGSNENDECYKCQLDQCIEYDDSCQCQVCHDGYGAVTDSATQVEVCVKCTLNNCKNCIGDERDDCIACLDGYFLYHENGKNKACTGCQVENCGSCSESGLTCTECVEGFYVDSKGKCAKCTFENCASCDSSSCKRCLDGYFLNGNKCTACNSPCKKCEQNADHCTACIDNYTLTLENTCKSDLLPGHGCVEGEPCNAENNDIIYIEYEPAFPKYSSVKNEKGNGGALHVINCNFKAEKTEFSSCQSVTGGGGGVYIKNTMKGKSEINLDGVKFTSCSAQFGGGLYIFSPDEKNPVSIKNCQFVDCKSLPKSSGSSFFGGSAVYLTVANGNVDLCTFRNNKGEGGMIKVTEDYLNMPDDLKMLSNSTAVSLSISRCTFDSSAMSGSSIFFSNKCKESFVEVKGCEFRGNLAKGTHFIDGTSSLDVQKLNIDIRHCRFESGQKGAINSKLVKIDLNKNNNEVRERNLKLETKLLIGMASAALVAIVAIIVVINKRIRDNNEEIDNSEMQDTSSETVNA